jgi:hypothetical protein
MESAQQPHEPNGDRWIRLQQGNIIYIVKEKEKEYPSMFSLCTFFSIQEDTEKAIGAMLAELNKDCK